MMHKETCYYLAFAAKPLLKWYIALIESTLVTSNKNGAHKNWKRIEVQKCERGD
jgi:hypothetical protein